MIKIDMRRVENPLEIKLIPYNSISRIPFSLEFKGGSINSETVYYLNLNDSDFIEFRFNKESGALYNIACVSLDNSKLRIQNNQLDVNFSESYYQCILSSNDSADLSEPIEITKYATSIQLSWSSEEKKIKLNDEVIFGISNGDNLTEFILNKIDKHDINNILGI